MARRQLILELWNEYTTTVLKGVDPTSTQYIETQRAFYAAAHGIVRKIMSLLDPGTEETQNDMWLMEDLEAEAQAFAKRIQEGAA